MSDSSADKGNSISGNEVQFIHNEDFKIADSRSDNIELESSNYAVIDSSIPPIKLSEYDKPVASYDTQNQCHLNLSTSELNNEGNDNTKDLFSYKLTSDNSHNLNNHPGAINNQNLLEVREKTNENESFGTNRILATSTVSLNDPNLTSDITVSKSLSKSAENLMANQISDNNSLNSSNNNLNTERILSEFMTQKNKVTATQKIPENNQNADVKIPRLPKELLPQDIGSIVKNVHGIFSSVSGSLKNAYNYTPKTHIKVLKPIPNSKVMDDIFEEGKTEKTIEQNITDSKIKNSYSIPCNIPNLNSEHLNEPTVTQPVIENEKNHSGDVYRLQIESLDQVVAEFRKENTSLRDRMKQLIDDLNVKDQMFKELEGKIDSMSKRVEQAEREKDAAVMRYASVECAAIEAKRAADTSAKAERSAANEVELLNNKLKSAHSEKQRICQLYDDKCHALQQSEREMFKIREEIRELEGRLKWTQSKLRMEMDAYKESAEKAERLTQQVSELETAKGTAVANATDSARARQLESDLKESQAALILCRHEKEELDKRLASITVQFDSCKRERDSASASLSIATAEMEKLKASNLRLEEEAAELASLRAQAALADTLSTQLQRETERAVQAEEALHLERARAETCSRREAAALEHSAKLTNRHVQERERATQSEAKAQALAADNVSLRERISKLEQESVKLQSALCDESERRNKENKVLARKVAELTEDLAEATKQLEWEKGENSVLKKKQQSAIKELNRELQRSLKRCELLEAKIPQHDAGSTRTGSVSSLCSSESTANEEKMQNGHTNEVPDVQHQTREPDRQTLIERIVSLQRDAARRSDRCEFLEEHNKQLTEELRKKAKLLRHLLPATPHGAMASNTIHNHKKEIARLGSSSMAALWGDDPSGITLELSLEMNKKLQSVLEDTLLKNITLKESMDTLGEEIARLKQQKSNTS